MTAATRRSLDLHVDHLPPRPRLLPPSLRLAPELAVLAVLDDALRTALVALVAAHPTLDELSPHKAPPTLRSGRRLVRALLALRDLLDDYRTAADNLAVDMMPDDDIPF